MTCRAVNLIAFAFAVCATAAIAQSSVREGSLSGLCVDTGAEGGCMGRYLPLDGRSIGLCEGSCTLVNPTAVRGMNATLYDQVCSGYETGGRVMLLEQQGYNPNEVYLYWINDWSVSSIVPCPAGY